MIKNYARDHARLYESFPGCDEMFLVAKLRETKN